MGKNGKENREIDKRDFTVSVYNNIGDFIDRGHYFLNHIIKITRFIWQLLSFVL